MSKTCGRTIGSRIRICRCDDASGRCKRFKSPGSAQRFLAVYSVVQNTFNVQRHLVSRNTLRVLTEEGERFYQEVRSLVAGIDDAAKMASGAALAVSGRLRVSVDMPFGHLMLAPRLADVRVAVRAVCTQRKKTNNSWNSIR
jgi:hypothetical protein